MANTNYASNENMTALMTGIANKLSTKVDKVTGKGLSTNDYDATAKTKLDGLANVKSIGTGLNLNSSTGELTATGAEITIDDELSTTSENPVQNKVITGSINNLTTAVNGKIASTEKGANNGVATLDNAGKVPSSQLPSYVDDVLEYEDLAHFPLTGETGKIYVAEDTNKTYRWSGSAYVEISESLALGETSSTAYAGNKGKANADAIAAIKDGASIDSFGDVETALASKADTSSVTSKADKVASATNGHLASLDANGNLADSGKSASDLETTALTTAEVNALLALLN